ncbi:1-acyl-sn-glycerol-3-phosphate acyltransferase [Nostoc sp. HG1]|nr:1-acyl-sn-glycerol-3-phosphate acyltransferase [Nostoc sp. HG1]
MPIRSLLYILVFFSGSLFHAVTAFVGSLTSPALMRWAVRGWARYQYFCARWILGIDVRVEGSLANRPVLYAIKHESMFETIDMPRQFERPSVVAKKQLFDIPFWGKAALAYGMIPVDREGGAGALRDMLTRSRALLADGRPIIIFPEGTRVVHGEQPPLQSGFAGLYKMLGVPVVPVAVDSGKIMPRDRWLRQSGVITYKVGEEIPAGLPRAEVEARVHKAMNALNG